VFIHTKSSLQKKKKIAKFIVTHSSLQDLTAVADLGGGGGGGPRGPLTLGKKKLQKEESWQGKQ